MDRSVSVSFEGQSIPWSVEEEEIIRYSAKQKVPRRFALRKDRYSRLQRQNRTVYETLVNLIYEVEKRERRVGERKRKGKRHGASLVKVKTHRGYKVCPPRGHKSFQIAARDQNCIVLAREIRFPFRGNVEPRASRNDLFLPRAENGILSNMQRLLALEGERKNVYPLTFPRFHRFSLDFIQPFVKPPFKTQGP